MKRFIILIFLVISTFACEENTIEPQYTSDNLENETSPLVCMLSQYGDVSMFWNDNYDNEIGYYVNIIRSNSLSEIFTLDESNKTSFKISLGGANPEISVIEFSSKFKNNLSYRTRFELQNPGSNFFLSEVTDQSCMLNWQLGVGEFENEFHVKNSNGEFIQSLSSNLSTGQFKIIFNKDDNYTCYVNGLLENSEFLTNEVSIERHGVNGEEMARVIPGTLKDAHEIIPLSNNIILVLTINELNAINLQTGKVDNLKTLFSLPFPSHLSNNLSVSKGTEDIFAIYREGLQSFSIIDGNSFTKIRDVALDGFIKNIKFSDGMIYIVTSGGIVYRGNINDGEFTQAGSILDFKELIPTRKENYWYSYSENGIIKKNGLDGFVLTELDLSSFEIKKIVISPDDKTLIVTNGFDIMTIDCSDMSLNNQRQVYGTVQNVKFLTEELCMISLTPTIFQIYNTKLNTISAKYAINEKVYPLLRGGYVWYNDVENGEYYSIDGDKLIKGKIINDWLIMYK